MNQWFHSQRRDLSRNIAQRQKACDKSRRDSHTLSDQPHEGKAMKWTILLLLLVSIGAAAQTRWQPEGKSPIPQLTPAAAKCDVSACQQNCYIQQSQCNNDKNGACGSLAQICVQNCASQCR
ncbi:hypothetical protein L579_3447 [Pantoea sp. AS-PWVM4]|nr:hypothetical protein [Pantoea sp. AS-PWVM4]ERK17567.1 hypothetical protein L579_3447 [Pantoea sp. AS-PWVM4]